MTTRVKICGITREEDLDAAVEAGADALGFVIGITSSPRNLSLTKATRLIKQVPPFVTSVLVTVPQNIGDFAVYEKLNPDVIQFHGETVDTAELVRLKLPNTRLIWAVNVQLLSHLDAVARVAKHFDAVLVDSFAVGRYGGTGVVHDWDLSRHVKQAVHPQPLILAGGLTPENVAEAVCIVEPYAVDVSTGVEWHPGIKSHQKMVEFIKNAKRC